MFPSPINFYNGVFGLQATQCRVAAKSGCYYVYGN